MRVLVVGGTGGFGATICRELVGDGHVVTAGARDVRRGRAFAEAHPGIAFVRTDRSRIAAHDLSGHDVVVDASGPFQGGDHSLARAAIAAGVHYLDIADDRRFVGDVGTLDDDARRAGVVVLSGASSIPALSTAAALETAHGMTEVRLVEIAISASSRAAFGRSVLNAMLAGAGRPIRRSDGTSGIGMSGPRRLVVQRNGAAVLERGVLEVDGPDQDSLPGMLPGHPSVRFHAGSELGMHNAAMRIISGLVRHGVSPSGTVFARLAGLARRPTSGLGNGRSAMEVRVTGVAGGRVVERTWSLLAVRGHGPRIPAMAVPALVARIAAGGTALGARSAAGMVSTRDVLDRMPSGSIDVEIREADATPLYRRVMPGLDLLDEEVRRFHQATPAVAVGRASVRGGRSVAARIVRAVFGFPADGDDVPVTVEAMRDGDDEIWTRTFGGRAFTSRLSPEAGGVEERFGPFAFRFALDAAHGTLRMVPISWSLLGVPMPRRMMPDGVATERGKNGAFAFNVPIRVPGIGPIVHYVGRLETTGRAGTAEPGATTMPTANRMKD